MLRNSLVILAILVLLLELYRYLRKYWLHRLLEKKKAAKRPRKPPVLRPKSEKDCPVCQQEKGKYVYPQRELPVAWKTRKGSGGRKKRISTAGYFCPNPKCVYYGIREEAMHALVGDGRHGKQEGIQDFKCQACGKKFTSRRNTVLYRLKTATDLVEKILWLLALGVDISALEEVFGIREMTIRTWLCRSGMQGRKLHKRFLVELELVHVQLDELWSNIVKNGLGLWVWVVSDVKTKLIPVMQVGERNQTMAYGVVHELKQRLAANCVPVFSADGLKHYFYALTAHFGKWEAMEGKKKWMWVLFNEFVYGQVVSFA